MPLDSLKRLLDNKKSLFIIFIALILALTGCSSAPSIEERTKLIEYEECLSFASDSVLASRKRIQEILSNLDVSEKLRQAVIPEDDFLQFYEENLIDRCVAYRP